LINLVNQYFIRCLKPNVFAMVNTKSLTTISIAAVTTTMMGNPYILLVKAEKFSKEYSDSIEIGSNQKSMTNFYQQVNIL